MKARILKELREWALALIGALVVFALIYTFLFQIIRVDGASMYPTLKDGERVVAAVLGRKLNGVQRGDVVICRYPGRGHTSFVKRVWGVPGDLIERVDGITYVNGEPIEKTEEDYRLHQHFDDYSYVLGEDEYFCVGDNFAVSHDSRAWKDDFIAEADVVGPITGDMIVARVKFVIWPLNQIRTVE